MVDVLLGLQWGDEGKGKIADFLTPRYDVVARFQGGPNAGHSLEINGMKHVLNTIPSGIFHENCANVIGNGVVVDPVRLQSEIERTIEAGAPVKENLFISYKAHIILPTHQILDQASEWAKGDAKIGSTLRGIGPTYRDKIGRNGIRVGDILSKDFEWKYRKNVERALARVSYLGFEDFDLKAMEEEFFNSLDYLKQFEFINSEYFVYHKLQEGKKILAEGAQGSMLDVDFGSYPFVTSSNTITGGVSTGLGIAPKHINKVIGIFKAYCTRVGSGPFPTELLDETGEKLRKAGHEFGATTGRPRRCGWLDLTALKYAIMLSGVDELCMMKSDVLSGFDDVKVGTGYSVNGSTTDEVPFNLADESLNPILKSMTGWSEDITGVKDFDHLPTNVKDYVAELEKDTNTPIRIVSVGPGRDQTITR